MRRPLMVIRIFAIFESPALPPPTEQPISEIGARPPPIPPPSATNFHACQRCVISCPTRRIGRPQLFAMLGAGCVSVRASSSAPNQIRSCLLLRVITHVSMASEFAQACLLVFLSAPRAPSEALQLVRDSTKNQMIRPPTTTTRRKRPRSAFEPPRKDPSRRPGHPAGRIWWAAVNSNGRSSTGTSWAPPIFGCQQGKFQSHSTCDSSESARQSG